MEKQAQCATFYLKFDATKTKLMCAPTKQGGSVMIAGEQIEEVGEKLEESVADLGEGPGGGPVPS